MSVALFPYLPGVTFPVDRSPIWDTTTQVSVSGKQTRFANRTQPSYRYALDVSGLDAGGAFASLAAQSKQRLEALFNNTFGGASIFFFWDGDDNTVVAQPFGTGDGTTTAFQLYRSTAAGWNDAIYAPVIAGGSVIVMAGGSATAPYGAPLIYKGGALQSGASYSISSAGVVTFNAAPASGAALSWTGSFWWPCNFDDDTLQLSQVLGGLWEAKSIKFTTRIF